MRRSIILPISRILGIYLYLCIKNGYINRSSTALHQAHQYQGPKLPAIITPFLLLLLQLLSLLLMKISLLMAFLIPINNNRKRERVVGAEQISLGCTLFFIIIILIIDIVIITITSSTLPGFQMDGWKSLSTLREKIDSNKRDDSPKLSIS